jgi:hypothetical protein
LSTPQGLLAETAVPIAPRTRKRSGLLHLISHAERVARSPRPVERPRPETPPTAAQKNEAQARRVGLRQMPMVVTQRFLICNIRGASRELISDETLRELRYIFGAFGQEKAALMSAIDKKVDRDLVERLFDKFRTMMMGMNERIREMATLSERFATTRDVKAVAQLVQQIPELNETAASRVGPECLVCGRHRGQVGSNEDDDQAIHYVYGDGGMFRKTAGTVGKIRLPALRPADGPEAK